jgi:hypothetical protein
MPETPSVCNSAQARENEREKPSLNYESPALTAELQAHGALPREHRTSNIQRPILREADQFF